MSDAFDEVRRIARESAPDRYVAALLAPRSARHDLIALAAFAAEIERIAQQVSEPHLGEIKMQWWRDALQAGAGGEASGHPVADAFASAIRRHALPLDSINDYLDAQVHTLYADAPDSEASLGLELRLKEGVLFELAARTLAANDEAIDAAQPIFKDAAGAYGLTRLALNVPYALSRGRMPLPATLAPKSDDAAAWRVAIAAISEQAHLHLGHVRDAYGAQPVAIKSAILPVALVEPYLRACSNEAHDPRRDIADIAPLTRTWRLAKTHMRGRIG